MGDTPWTPGPWFLSQDNGAGEYDVLAPDGDEDPWNIAGTFGGLNNQEHANARLIAAAPEMAELLEQIFNRAKTRWQLQEDVRALLSKIKGQPDE